MLRRERSGGVLRLERVLLGQRAPRLERVLLDQRIISWSGVRRRRVSPLLSADAAVGAAVAVAAAAAAVVAAAALKAWTGQGIVRQRATRRAIPAVREGDVSVL